MAKSHAIIVGAGLAGCQMAYELSRRGWLITLIDQQNQLASQASGNPAAITYPTVSSTPAAVSRLAIDGWQYIYELLQEMPTLRYKISGALKLLQNDDEKLRWKRALENHALSIDWMEYADKQNASQIAGISLNEEAIYLKRSAWVDIPDYCQHLLRRAENIKWIPATEVIDFDSESIQTKGEKIYADAIIFCNAHEVSKLRKLSWIPLRKVRGQLLTMKTLLPKLKTILCFDGFITPDLGNGSQQLGATYDRESEDLTPRESDNNELFSKLKVVVPSISTTNSVIKVWTQFRTNIAGMEPLIGHAYDENKEKMKNIFIFSAFSSKGLVYIPSGAKILSELITKQTEDRDLSRFSPKRFCAT